MHNKIPFHNDSDAIRYAPDGARVMPGETRMIDGQPSDTPAKPAEPVDPMQVLAEGNAKTIVDALPTLDASQLDRLAGFEGARAKPRTTVLQAIELRKLELKDLDPPPAAGEGEGKGEGEKATDAPAD